MKRTKFLWGATALIFAMSLGLVSCSDSDGENSPSVENSKNPASSSADITDNESEFDPDVAAFNVLRSLCNLAEYDDNRETDEDGSYTGIETLPDGWETISFTCDQGVVLDAENPTVRSIAANCIDDAREFFSSMIGKDVTSDSYTWDCTRVGNLTFKAVKNDEDLYATIDIDVGVLPDVTQLRFVPAEVIDAAGAENSFSGKPYYSAGDVIQRNSDGTYWICVRPAGGPLRKDKSYWICLHPFDKNEKSIIKTEVKKNVKTYHEDENAQDEFVEIKNDWTYAKNLMTLKTAKAAHHTFNCIVNPKAYEKIYKLYSEPGKIVVEDDVIGSDIYDSLVSKGFDLMNLHRAFAGQEALSDAAEYTAKEGNFCFAYGSPKKDSARVLYGKNENCDVNYVQPMIIGSCNQLEGNKIRENISTRWASSTLGLTKFLLSVTDSYDQAFINEINDIALAYQYAYNYSSYLHKYDKKNLAYVDLTAAWMDMTKFHVIFSPELCINDNKGKETAKKPSSAYTDILRSGQTEWWWASLETSVRYVDGTKVEWNKENK